MSDTSISAALTRRAHAAWLLIALTCAGFWVGCANQTHDVTRPDVAESIGGANEPVSSAGSGQDTTTGPTWCDVERVLKAKCQRCHAETPQHGAPFALVSYADTQVVAKSGRTRCAAIEAVLADDYMPPRFISLEPPIQPLEAAEKQQLLDWCGAGAVDADGCASD